MKRTIISTSEAPAAVGPYSQAVAVEGGRTVYLSGQIPLDPKTGVLVEGDVAAQTQRVLDNLAAVLAAAEMDFSNLVKVGIFLADIDDFSVVNDIYERRFEGDPPARATIGVGALPKGVRVEIDGIAVG